LAKLLAILGLLLVTQASAQGICAGFSATGPSSVIEAAPTWVALPCIPDVIGGTGKGYNLRVSPAGVVPWLWCPNGTGWALRWGALTWEDAAPIAAGMPAALVAADKRKAISDLAYPHTGKDIALPELKALWCPHWAAMMASRPQSPIQTTWVTVGGSSYNTLNNALASYAGIVARNLPCNDTIPAIRIGTTVYKNFTGATRPTIVAACRAP
jgi:hypothetical protein